MSAHDQAAAQGREWRCQCGRWNLMSRAFCDCGKFWQATARKIGLVKR